MKESIRELRCHYLVTCVYNNIQYNYCGFVVVSYTLLGERLFCELRAASCESVLIGSNGKESTDNFLSLL